MCHLVQGFMGEVYASFVFHQRAVGYRGGQKVQQLLLVWNAT